VRVIVEASFAAGPVRTLIAEIPGRTRAAERIVLVAHVQEPGANDNGSGAATQFGIARGLLDAIRSGALPRPERTLTFMWVDEIRGSRQWLSAHPADARRVQYMFALDMTGEDTAKTGGTFLIEKQADPSAVWDRPSDPHTAWGGGGVRADVLKGSLLNDLHLAVCLRRARDTGWVVRTNPYEGGSDHTVFASAGVPSVLNWHFTDRFYHTNQDRLDKVSAAEMQNVGTAVAATAWVLSSADEQDALAVADIVAAAGIHRLAVERSQGEALVERAADKDAARETERRVNAAWMKWYGEALDSVSALPASPASERLLDHVAAAKDAMARQAVR
jgi:aminopeptidase YwaD